MELSLRQDVAAYSTNAKKIGLFYLSLFGEPHPVVIAWVIDP